MMILNANLRRGPSRMEIFGCGLASLIPHFVALNGARYPQSEFVLIGLGSFLAGFAIATGRVTHSYAIGAWVAVLMLPTLVFDTFMTSGCPVDPRFPEPMSIRFLPAPLMERNPAGGGSTGKVAIVWFYFMLSKAVLVRFVIGNKAEFPQYFYSVLAAIGTFVVLIAFHFAIMPEQPGWQTYWRYNLPENPPPPTSEIQFFAGVHSFLLAYGLFYVVLFYDLTRKSQPARTAANEPLNNTGPVIGPSNPILE